MSAVQAGTRAAPEAAAPKPAAHQTMKAPDRSRGRGFFASVSRTGSMRREAWLRRRCRAGGMHDAVAASLFVDEFGLNSTS